MRTIPVVMAALAVLSAAGLGRAETLQQPMAPRPYCAPEVNVVGAVEDEACAFDGVPEGQEHKTLLIYLHGALPARHGVAYLQQRAMATHAKANGVTVLMPHAPETEGFHFWPRSPEAIAAQEAGIVERIRDARRNLEEQMHVTFENVYVVGFSSGAYYASSLAVRGVLDDVDGYIVLAGGCAQPAPEESEEDVSSRVPVFVGINGGDPTTMGAASNFAGELRGLKWPTRSEVQGTGHLVDGVLLAHGIAWLRGERD